MDLPLFELRSEIGPELEKLLRDSNPWWRGDRIGNLPPMRRWGFAPARQGLASGLSPITAVRGPRQVGKTTLLQQIVNDLIAAGVLPARIFRVQFDDLPQLHRLENPILELSRWFSETILRKSFHRASQDGEQAFILLDEVQNLENWAAQLKQLVDINPVRVLITGSSALRIEAGRDSLAGRVHTLDLGPLLMREIAELRDFGKIEPFLSQNGLTPLRDKETWRELVSYGLRHTRVRSPAFHAFSERGGYPVAQARWQEPWERVADFLRESVIQRAIRHDLRMGPRGQRRDEHLLEEVFRLACRYAGQAPGQSLYLEEINRPMRGNIGWQRVQAYLKVLDGTLLLRLIEPLELRLRKKRGPSKVCLCDHALRAAWLHELVPLSPEGLDAAPHLAGLAGHLAESAAGYYLRSIRGLGVVHFPERAGEPEVDFVLTVGEQRIPLEVKYRRRIDYEDTRGLRAFIEKSSYNAPFGVLVTLADGVVVDDPRIVSLPLSSLLMLQ